MPVTSDASAFTSVTASPMEPHETEDLPIELKIPLPPSNAASDEEEEVKVETGGETLEAIATEEIAKLSVTVKTPPRMDEDGLAPGYDTGSLHTSSSTPLAELARLNTLDIYERHLSLSAQERLDILRLSYGLDRRRISSFSIAYGNMIDQYKTDDQAGFAGLYEACEQLKGISSVSGTSFGHVEHGFGTGSIPSDATEKGSFIQSLPTLDLDNILTFLNNIRNDENFLSERISNLLPTQLLALTSSYHPPGIDYSVLQNHSHGKTQLYSRESQMMKLSRRMDNLQRFHHEDPFFTLIYVVFDSSAKANSLEVRRRLEVWSTTCARNFIEAFTRTRPGSDELAIATLDAFATFEEWPLKPKMEAYLQQALVEGSFLLDPLTQQPADPKEPVEVHRATAAIKETEFFEKALTDLFGLLTAQPTTQAVPRSALAFVHATLRKIEDSKLRLRAKHYIVCRWYFATFISSILLHPEVRGIMMLHHIGETARQKILQQLVLRLQQRVFDVILQWNGQALVNPEIQEGIMAIFQSFEPPVLSADEPAPVENGQDSTRFLMLSALDVIGLVQTLCPEKPSEPETQNPDSTVGLSDRPSTAGSSTLIAGFSDGGSADAPSTAPSSFETTDKGNVEEPHSDSKRQDMSIMDRRDLDDVSGSATTASGISGSQLSIACRNLKDVVARADSPGGANTWTLFYYSKDGLSLSLENQPRRRHYGSEPLSREQKPVVADSSNNKSVLKTTILELLVKTSKSDTDADFGYPRSISATHSQDPLQKLLEGAIAEARSRLNYNLMYSWCQTSRLYRDYVSSPEASPNSLLIEIAEDLRKCIEESAAVARHCEMQCKSLRMKQEYHNRLLAKLDSQRNALRIKMWYASDVRHSATYEETLLVTRALRTMASPKRAKHPSSLSNWARQRLRGSSIHARSETQTLEALAAPKEYGGPAKLADEQVDLTSRWLTRRSIENFCKGEERIHRFCFEVHKSAGKLAGTSLLDNPVLWSSNLFKRERLSLESNIRPNLGGKPSGPTMTISNPLTYSALHSPALALPDASSRGLGLSKVRSPIDYPATSSNALQGFPPYNGVQALLPPTPTSPPASWTGHGITSDSPIYTSTPLLSFMSGYRRHSTHLSSEGNSSLGKDDFVEQTRRSLYSLLLSDLGYLLWNRGSETDAWVNDFVDENPLKEQKYDVDLTTRRRSFDLISWENLRPEKLFECKSADASSPANRVSDASNDCSPSLNAFPFFEAYATLLRRFAMNLDPYCKLDALYELEGLIIQWLHSEAQSRPARATDINQINKGRLHLSDTTSRSKSVPRTKATSLEEVVANCTERRTATFRYWDASRLPASQVFAPEVSSEVPPGADDIVDEIISIFHSTDLRPTTLFRDLQYIAVFVPGEVLDKTPQGKAFWDFGLAALALKDDLCQSMTARANEITSYHISSMRVTGPSSDNTLASTTLRDAANLWLITAKEGSPVAARELGLFYLTHPELLPRVTLPFSKVKNVFKSVGVSDTRTGDKETGALDPYTFAVVRHWMEIAANGGDRDASDFLRGSGDVRFGR